MEPLNLTGADLPGPGESSITDIIPAALATIDPTLPGASPQAARVLDLEVGARQVLLILVDGFGYELMVDHMGHTPTLRSVRFTRLFLLRRRPRSPRSAPERARALPTWLVSRSRTAVGP